MNYRRTYIIAEAGVNHNGSLELAREMVVVAAEAGADAVKFQTFRADKLVAGNAPKAEYQKRKTSQAESQYEMIKKLELDEEAHRILIEDCKKRKVDFLSTPFDPESLRMLMDTFHLPLIKVSSGDITNAPFLLEVAKRKKPVILSTGMSSLGDIETALGVLALGYTNGRKMPSRQAFKESYRSEKGRQILARKVTLLHCTTEYPAPLEEVNLRAMAAMSSTFNLSVGYSDHTTGIAVPVAAVALGAVIIEKHFTLDRKMTGPDHEASLEPGELRAMVQSIRDVEKALGSRQKAPTPSELKNRVVAQKSIVAAAPIHKGEQFTEKNVTVKRPGSGISPVFYWDIIGRRAVRDYSPDEVILL